MSPNPHRLILYKVKFALQIFSQIVALSSHDTSAYKQQYSVPRC